MIRDHGLPASAVVRGCGRWGRVGSEPGLPTVLRVPRPRLGCFALAPTGGSGRRWECRRSCRTRWLFRTA